MLKGHVFKTQSFTTEAFALFIDIFLGGNCGIAKGCELTKTTNSISIGEGFFVIKGRFLQIIESETVNDFTQNGFYSLICEIDLSKTNTTDSLNQAQITTVYNASAYPVLEQSDITGTGTKYQYEFAKFKVENGVVANLTDTRTFIEFESIYNKINKETAETNEQIREITAALIDEISNNLNQVLDESIYLLKSGGTATGDFNFTGNIAADNIRNSSGSKVVFEDELKSGARTTITRGTDVPTGGNDGDIYIQYFD